MKKPVSFRPLFAKRPPLRPQGSVRLKDTLQALSWSPSGAWLAAAAVSGQILVLDSKSLTERVELAGHGLGTMALAFRPGSETTLASVGLDGTVRLWDTETGTLLAQAQAGAAWVELLAWSPDGRILVTGAGKHVRYWDASLQELKVILPPFESTVATLAWNPTGSLLAVAGYGGVWLVDAQGTCKQRFAWKGSILKLAWSPNGEFLVTGNQDATVHFWELATGEELQMWGYATKVLQLSWNTTGRWLATGGGEGISLWDFRGEGPAGSKPRELLSHTDFVETIAFQHRGQFLASGGLDSRLILWKPEHTTDPVVSLQLRGAATVLSWSPDDLKLAVGDTEGYVAFFELTNEK